jgi:hypothetical protein
VVGFSGMYHAILGRPAYTNFMAMPNYTYLKMKIPGPKGIITVGTTYQRAFECDAECFQFTEALIWSERLHAGAPVRGPGHPQVVQASDMLFQARQGRQGCVRLRRWAYALYRDDARS